VPPSNLLKELIPRDVTTLKARCYAVCRPTVFLLGGGEPSDRFDWLEVHRSLSTEGDARGT
jgi:uncharacterized protein YegL